MRTRTRTKFWDRLPGNGRWGMGFMALLVLSSLLMMRPGRAATTTVVLLGDSITQGKNTAQDSFRDELHALLTDNGYNVDFVGSHTRFFQEEDGTQGYDQDHEGHWGWRANHIINGRSGDNGSGTGKLAEWLTAYTPDIALIHIGSNDMFQEESVDSTVSEIEEIIDILRGDNANVVILLAQLIPTSDEARNSRVDALNAEIPGIATRKSTASSPIVVVDQNSGFDSDGDTYDGVHPNETGEVKMAQVWYAALTPWLGTTPAATPTASSTAMSTQTSTATPTSLATTPSTSTATPTATLIPSTAVPLTVTVAASTTPPSVTVTPQPTSDAGERSIYLPAIRK